MQARWMILALLAVSVAVLGGCRQTWTGSSCCKSGVPPLDLPQNPDPCCKYCKVWVPPTCQKCSKKRVCYGGGVRCDESLVQTKPGGYRWETDGNCWHYCYRNPEYKWCNRVVQEDKIDYCYCPPPKWKTVVETVPVQVERSRYVPAQYEIQYCPQLWTPGHYEWRKCPDPCWCTPDKRRWSRPVRMPGCAQAVSSCCPRTN